MGTEQARTIHWLFQWIVVMMLTPKQAAERLHVSPSVVYAWCARKRINHYRVGVGNASRGKILIDAADLDTFLQTLAVTPVVAASEPPEPVTPSRRRLKLRHVQLPSRS